MKYQDPIDHAITRMAPHGRIRHIDRDLIVAFLIRTDDMRPLEAPWWSGKEVSILGADLDGNFFLRHCSGAVLLWDHRKQKEEEIARSVKEFADRIK
jgi:hypothetical protein